MKHLYTVLALVVCLGACLTVWAALPNAAPPTSLDPEVEFTRARQAYDDGDLESAVQLYTALLNAGYRSKEVFYNLGNVLYRLGRNGDAVWAYMSARYFSPRDPDIAANIRFVQNGAGVSEVTPPLLTRAASILSMREWIYLSVVAYWLLAVTLCIAFIVRRKLQVLPKLMALFVMILALSLLGSFYWLSLRTSPQYVVTQPSTKALYGPFEDSTAFFDLPAGSVVRSRETAHDWVRVQNGSRSGWVRSDSLRAVSPWNVPEGIYTRTSTGE